MIIYGEYLFAENFVTGYLLLLLTARLSGKTVNWLRLFAAGAICGAGGFAIFVPVRGVTAAVAGIAAGLVVTWVAFGSRGIIKTTMLFISLTFLSGGAAMALMLWRSIPAISGNGALYVEPLTYVQLIVSGVGAFGLTSFFVKILKERRIAGITKGKVCLKIGGRSYLFEALADSGNSLQEPLTGRPVMLLDIKGAARLPVLPPERYVVVPYRAVGTEKGLLKGFRADEIEFDGRSFRNAVVAFYEGDFGDVEMLLNREVLNEDITETG